MVLCLLSAKGNMFAMLGSTVSSAAPGHSQVMPTDISPPSLLLRKEFSAFVVVLQFDGLCRISFEVDLD